MRLFQTISWGAFLLAGVAEARPANKKNDECTTKETCKKIKNVLGYKAIPACSAYLGPRTKTITVTKATIQTARKTTQLPRKTKSVTVARTTTLLQTSKETRYTENPTTTLIETVQTGEASTTTVYKYIEPQKRSAPTVNPLLRDMEKRHPKKFVSEACSCVYKPTTKTATRTVKVTKYTTKTSTKPAPPPLTKTTTKNVSVTQKVVITTSLGPTSTVTARVTSSVAPDVVVITRPATCNRRGFPNFVGADYYVEFNSNEADCLRGCKADDRCQSVQLYLERDPNNSQLSDACRYYSRPAAEVASFGMDPRVFWDKDCPVRET